MEVPPQEEFSTHEEDEEKNVIKLPATIADSDKGELFK